jgi:cytochrome c oxidase subunit IV
MGSMKQNNYGWIWALILIYCGLVCSGLIVAALMGLQWLVSR